MTALVGWVTASGSGGWVGCAAGGVRGGGGRDRDQDEAPLAGIDDGLVVDVRIGGFEEVDVVRLEMRRVHGESGFRRSGGGRWSWATRRPGAM
jgi:hypothetical protein